MSLVLSVVPSPTAAAAIADNALVKSPESSSVYYVSEGKRFAFPNDRVYFSWYGDFSTVVTISPAELANLPLSGNVTYKPGVKLVKIQTDPRVYAVSRFGYLHWITSEAIAKALYGDAWNKNVDDIPDTFFTNYFVKEAITSADAYSPRAERAISSISLDLGEAIHLMPENLQTDAGVSTVAGCQMFPADNAWNQDVSALPVRSDSATFIASIGSTAKLHPDFGENQSYGIPYNVVLGTQTNVPITFTSYGDESDPGPYPIPSDAKVESGNDAHVLVLQKQTCWLFELYHAQKTSSGWSADSGAKWNLDSNNHRTLGWTSADAAGLPILPGLVRFDEVELGEIKHAIRFTAPSTQNGYILPATHFAGSDDASLPPMGLRVRLKADYDISRLTGQARVIATAMKKYGMILADNGSPWYFQGATDPGWSDEELDQLKTIPGSAFEAVDTGAIMK
jgi:hypothetical protein